MQLRNSRLCLDCEEVHDAQQCPVCASESFAFLTRWVPAPERRERPRTQEPERPSTAPDTRLEELQAYRALLDPSQKPNGRGWQLVRQGAMGLALVGVAGWLWKSASAEAATDKAGGTGRAEKEPQ
jgi:hypothetical protein